MLDEANARSPHKLAKEIAAHLRSTTNQLFAHFPGINAEWNSRQIEAFTKSGIRGNREDWLPITLLGTTFSGHSFRTTIGNSIDSYMYMRVAFELATGRKPTSKDWDVYVSGDDVVALGKKKVLNDVGESYKLLAYEKKYCPHPYGLGQVLSSYSVTEKRDTTFCSKIFSDENGGVCSPDIRKALSTKAYYRGSNDQIHQTPRIHALAKIRAYGSASDDLKLLLTLAADSLPQVDDERNLLEDYWARSDFRFLGDLAAMPQTVASQVSLRHTTFVQAARGDQVELRTKKNPNQVRESAKHSSMQQLGV